jgi:FMNH2-dependent dimethyl sulfone monooxygenase
MEAHLFQGTPIVDGTLPREQGSVLGGRNRLKFAAFGMNLSGGSGGITFADGQLRAANWDEVSGLAIAAEEAGFEAMVPIGRWKGFGGPSGYWDRSYETFTWAAGIAAMTRRIQLFTTVHVGVMHPVIAAKMGATIDHISGGRWGLNVVAGWLGEEFDMFGAGLQDHSVRYELAEEWITVIRRLWTEPEPFDFNGRFFPQLKGAVSIPKPVQAPYPVTMCAGMSPAGQAFAVDNTDVIFINPSRDADIAGTIASIRETAAAEGRKVSIWGCVHVVCKPTEQEAADYVTQYRDEQGDYETAKLYAAGLLGADTSSHDMYRRNSDLMKVVMASGGLRTIVGSPEQVVDEIQELAEAGIDGLGVAWVNPTEGIATFRDTLMPMFEELGLREPSETRAEVSS